MSPISLLVFSLAIMLAGAYILNSRFLHRQQHSFKAFGFGITSSTNSDTKLAAKGFGSASSNPSDDSDDFSIKRQKKDKVSRQDEQAPSKRESPIEKEKSYDEDGVLENIFLTLEKMDPEQQLELFGYEITPQIDFREVCFPQFYPVFLLYSTPSCSFYPPFRLHT
jgi:hypothetical protein